MIKNPWVAAAVAFMVTATYIKFKYILNNMGSPTNAEIIKPSLLVAILVGMIVAAGDVTTERGRIMSAYSS